MFKETTVANSADSTSPPDHRDLGNILDLFHFQEEAPGMVFWHPRGLTLYRTLSDAARRRCRAEGYAEVRTPQVLRQSLWQRSGHWTHYHEDMFGFDDGKESAALKPVSCEYAQTLMAELDAGGLRVDIDASAQSLAHRIFQAHAVAVPFVVIIGNRELAAASVTVRERGGQNQTLPRMQGIDLLRERCKPAQ